MIRAALLEDARAIAEVHVLSWQHAYRDLLPQDFLAALSVEGREAMWAASLARSEPSLLVAEKDGKVVGFSAFGPCRDDGARPGDLELWALYLAPGQWSTGLGRALWLQSRKAMAIQGAVRISLWVLAGNQRAIRFYMAAGFEPEPDSAKSVELAGARFREIRYLLQDAGPAAPVVRRLSTSADAEFAYQVFERGMRDHAVATLGAWPESKVRASMAEHGAAGHIQLIFRGVEPVGMVCVERFDTHHQLEQLAVLPEYQGEGIGGRVLGAILAEARAAGLPVRLRVLRVNPAKRLYERHGFKVVSETPERFFMECE